MKNHQDENVNFEEILSECEKSIGYVFKDRKLLEMALTHTSYANERKAESYQRLEFLGDSVLSLVVSTKIYKELRTFPEGKLSRFRATLVCEETLAKFSLRNNIDKYMRLGVGEKAQNGCLKPSILADIFESIAGAIYLDGGMEEAKKYIDRYMNDEVKNTLNSFQDIDHKTNLQEYVAKNGGTVEYILVGETGPAHDKRFTIEARAFGKTAVATGKSKKEAEQEAAKIFLENEAKC